MKVTFAAPGAPASAIPRLVVRVVEQDKLPSGLDAGVADAARASRFAGKLGQVFESFRAAAAICGATCWSASAILPPSVGWPRTSVQARR